ncbi:MAG: Endosomal/lysosomal potassium channel [Candidatus Eremiobacteraeota bacterium]|jgi:uncharacterized membrane protein|nr:Endosomal/lysosomal potassium channel [Candidatus Eremiobacteraeota bacterium]MEA2720391.1 Endosomal/lysosomal potassium channel [Candidatus Eremiobacteraeota bacterium]
MRYRQTLPLGERHLVGRLESFGDIVLGFSMSQLALQLEIPKTPREVFGHPLNYFIFFAAFGLLGIFWLRFHRIMAIGFAPRPVDIGLLFAFLAFVAMVPYSLVTYMRLLGPAGYSRESVSLYLVDFLGVATFSWVLSIRGMRRAWGVLDETERPGAWRPVIAGFIIVPAFVIALAGVLATGPIAFGVLILIGPLVRFAVRLVPRPWPFLLGPQPAAAIGTLEPEVVS